MVPIANSPSWAHACESLRVKRDFVYILHHAEVWPARARHGVRAHARTRARTHSRKHASRHAKRSILKLPRACARDGDLAIKTMYTLVVPSLNLYQ